MSTEVGKLNGMSVRTGTSAGAAYVNKITHPPSPMSSEYQGRPDCSSPNVVLMELKAEGNVPPILNFPTSDSATKTINPSSMLFVQTSGAVVMNYIFMWLADAASNAIGWVQPQGQAAIASTQPAVTQTVNPSVNSSGYNFSQWQSDVASHRKTYKSSTYYLNATNFNNQGIVTSAKFKPDIVRGQSIAQLFEKHANCKKSTASLASAVRAACAHLGIKVVGETVDDFQFVTRDGVKLPGEQFSYQIWEQGPRPTGSGGTVPFSNQIFYNRLLPANSSELLVTSPKAATRPARDGAFVVQQQEDEIIPWIANYSTGTTIAAQPVGLNLCFMRFIDSFGVSNYIPLYSSNTSGNTNSPFTADAPWGSLDWSFTLFEGLTVPSTAGTTLTSVPYITVKSFLGLEIQPRSTSSLSTFQRTLPLPDSDAIKMAIGIMHARPDSLPAAANDLGSIAATAIKFIPTAVSWLREIFGRKAPESEKPKTASKPKTKPKVKPSAVARNKINKKSISSIDNRLSALTSAVNRMQVTASKSNAPATKLPTYTESALPRRNKKVRQTAPNQARVATLNDWLSVNRPK